MISEGVMVITQGQQFARDGILSPENSPSSGRQFNLGLIESISSTHVLKETSSVRAYIATSAHRSK